jgi:hypothetical protein
METRVHAVKRLCRQVLARTVVVAVAIGPLAVGGCGNLDNVTTVKDLRVLAVKSEPAGFLVPPDDVKSLAATEATLTALVVDPKGNAATLDFSAVACPDFIDTITSASGKGSKLCPGPEVTNALPMPLDTLLATTTPVPQGMVAPLAGSTIEYNALAKYDITVDKLQQFFATTNPVFAQRVQYNRDFGMDALVGFTFALGAEKATALKRVVYWPELPASATATIRPKKPDDPPRLDCPDAQVANQNPKLTSVDLYQHRVDGAPTDPITDANPSVSLAAGDELYVQPVWDPASIEKYFLRIKDGQTGQIETECHHELLTFQFYATAGTFSPPDRQSELSLIFDPTSVLRSESQYHPPGAADRPADGKVTLWVVVRDERAGESWSSRTINVVP